MSPDRLLDSTDQAATHGTAPDGQTSTPDSHPNHPDRHDFTVRSRRFATAAALLGILAVLGTEGCGRKIRRPEDYVVPTSEPPIPYVEPSIEPPISGGFTMPTFEKPASTK